MLKQWIPLLAIAVLIGGAMFVFQEPSEDPRIAELEAEVEALTEEREELSSELASYPESHELAQATYVAEQFVQAESLEEAAEFLSANANLVREEGDPTGMIEFEDNHMYEWLSPEQLDQRFADFQMAHGALVLSYATDVSGVQNHRPFFIDYVLVEEDSEWRISQIAFNATE